MADFNRGSGGGSFGHPVSLVTLLPSAKPLPSRKILFPASRPNTAAATSAVQAAAYQSARQLFWATRQLPRRRPWHWLQYPYVVVEVAATQPAADQASAASCKVIKRTSSRPASVQLGPDGKHVSAQVVVLNVTVTAFAAFSLCHSASTIYILVSGAAQTPDRGSRQKKSSQVQQCFRHSPSAWVFHTEIDVF